MRIKIQEILSNTFWIVARKNQKQEIEICFLHYGKALNKPGSHREDDGIIHFLQPEGITITKHGKPVARLVPVGAESAELIGSLKHKIKIKGDILSTGVSWDAQS